MNKKILASSIALIAGMNSVNVRANDPAENATQEVKQIEEMLVLGAKQSFATNAVSEGMVKQQSTITSINAIIDNLPGVSVNEGDTYGFDDWSTNITVRGFTTSLDEQQVGTTIDGLPNGNSNYGGGSKANRYIDSANIGSVSVSQGTSDIASRSLEALGGTIDFKTDNPIAEERFRAELAQGEFNGKRMYVRYDTGNIGESSRAWISLSHNEASDWINGSAENTRDHLAAKLLTEFGNTSITSYFSYDDTHEDNYQRVYSQEDFNAFPEWDQLTDTWTGIPYIDQSYRRGWSTLRENTFFYIKSDTAFSEDFHLKAGVYFHKQEGRGDWVPPYLVDITNDTGAETEFTGGQTVKGGSPIGRIYFVDGAGMALTPTDGCVSSLTFPYGGAGPEYDPACYADGAIGVQSYRHTHYQKNRTGLTLDFDWSTSIAGFDNVVRGGLWYEDSTRDEQRDWHKIADTRVGQQFDDSPYWVQYSRSYPQDVMKWYVEDTAQIGDFALNLGVKQFLVDVSRNDIFGDSSSASVNSDSDVLLSAGLVWHTPVYGMDLFAGYAENYKAIGDAVLETPDSDLSRIEPETSQTNELGVRYNNNALNLTATYFENSFENRLFFLSSESSAGPNYLIGTNGTYFNSGGIDSSGVELAATYAITSQLNAYFSYTMTDAEYVGTGDSLVDVELGIKPGNTVLGIADSQYVISLDWQGEKIFAGISNKFTGDRYADLDNDWKIRGFNLTDLYLGTNISGNDGTFKNAKINFTINNLFDEDYLGTIVSGGAWIGAPRTYVMSLTFDF